MRDRNILALPNQAPWLRAGFSQRRGGVSTAFFGESLNLGWNEADPDANVAENRRRFLLDICGDAGGQNAFSLVTVRQVHSDIVRVVGADAGPLATEHGRATLEGDGLVTNVPGVMLAVQTADCVGVLVADLKRRVVGAFHAGWKGTLAKIVAKGIGTMQQEFGCRSEDLSAAIGPSIGPCCYAVGTDLRDRFVAHFDYAAELFQERNGQTYLDLWEANRRQLAGAGVPPERISVLEECTSCAVDNGSRRYFSHRAEQGKAGRMMAVIGIVKEC